MRKKFNIPAKELTSKPELKRFLSDFQGQFLHPNLKILVANASGSIATGVTNTQSATITIPPAGANIPPQNLPIEYTLLALGIAYLNYSVSFSYINIGINTPTPPANMQVTRIDTEDNNISNGNAVSASVMSYGLFQIKGSGKLTITVQSTTDATGGTVNSSQLQLTLIAIPL